MSTVGLVGLDPGTHCAHLHDPRKAGAAMLPKKALRCRPPLPCPFESPGAACDA